MDTITLASQALAELCHPINYPIGIFKARSTPHGEVGFWPAANTERQMMALPRVDPGFCRPSSDSEWQESLFFVAISP